MEDYAKWCSERKAIMTRALALVLASTDHESAIQAAKDAFAKLADHYDPFKPEEPQTHEEAEVAA